MTEVKTVPIEDLIEKSTNQTVSGSLAQIISGQSEILDHLKSIEAEKTANQTAKKDLDQLEKTMKAFGKAISQQIDSSRTTHALMLKNFNECMNALYEFKKTIRGKK